MILGVGLVELLKTPPVHYMEHRLYQRQIVVYGLIGTQIIFLALQVFYSTSLEIQEPWTLGPFSQYWAQTASMVNFIVVEVLVAYNIDSYWVLLEEGCNIQQAKKIFRTVNNGQVVALGLVGFFVGFLPWSFYMSAASLMSLATFVILPCQALMYVIAPKDQVSYTPNALHAYANSRNAPHIALVGIVENCSKRGERAYLGGRKSGRSEEKA